MADGSIREMDESAVEYLPIPVRFQGLQAREDVLVAEFQVESGEVIETSLSPAVAERLSLALSVWLKRRSATPRW